MSAHRTLTDAETAELATLRESFAALSTEWNALNRATNLHARDMVVAAETPTLARQDAVARQLRACGERISTIERQQHGNDIPGYAETMGAR